MARRPRVAYLDSSALVKLVIPEPESAALRAELAGWECFASSALDANGGGAGAACVDPAAREPARQAVSALDLIAVGDEILEEAARLEPIGLRSLDAIHIAAALALGDALGAVVSYDERLEADAAAAGLPVLAPR